MTESILGRAKVPITADLSGLNEDLKRAHKSIEAKLSGALKSVGKKMAAVGKQLSMKVTAPILGLGTLVVKAAADFETAFAGVRKTVDATEEEYAALETGIRAMSKRISATPEEIAAVMEAAGQLGIAKEYLLDFTETMINLGVATNMSSTDAAVQLARLANITQMPQDQFDELGSTVVALGNNLATTESEIVAMGLRLAGAGSIIGMSNAQILGLAGGLSSVGIEAQAGGSAFSRVMIDMASAVGSATTGAVDNTEAMAKQQAMLGLLNSQLDIAEQRQSEFTEKTKESTRMANQLRIDKYRDEIAATQEMLAQLEASQGQALDPKKLKKFAQVAGMHVGEFRDLFEMDAAAAIVAFVEGLGKMRDEGEDVFGVLDELGMAEVRVRDALLRASGAGDLFRRAINLSSDAWGENTALTEEAEKRYATFTEQLKIVRNRFRDIAISVGKMVIPKLRMLMDRYIPPLIATLQKAVDWFDNLDESVQTNILGFLAIAAALGPVLMVLGPLVSGLGALISPMGLIIAAVGLLAVAWAKDWGGIRAWVRTFWEGKLQPALRSMQEWLQTKIPIAIERTKEFLGKLPEAFREFRDVFAAEGFVGALEAALDILGVEVDFSELFASIQRKWNTVRTIFEEKGLIEAVETALLFAGVVVDLTGLRDKISGALEKMWLGTWEKTGEKIEVAGEFLPVMERIGGLRAAIIAIGAQIPEWLKEGLLAAAEWLIPITARGREWAESADTQATLETIGHTLASGIIEGVRELLGSETEASAMMETLATSLGAAAVNINLMMIAIGKGLAKGLAQGVIDELASEETRGGWTAAVAGALELLAQDIAVITRPWTWKEEWRKLLPQNWQDLGLGRSPPSFRGGGGMAPAEGMPAVVEGPTTTVTFRDIVVVSPDPDRAGEDVIRELKHRGYLS